MKLEIQLSEKDCVEAQFLHMQPRPVFKWIGLFLFSLAFLVCVHGFIILPERGFHWRPFAIFASLLYIVLFQRVWLPFRAKQSFLQQKSSQEPYEVEITEDTIILQSSRSQTTMEWKDFYKYKKSKSMILLYLSDVLYLIFPVRFFSVDQFTNFQEILRANVGKPKP